MKSQLLCTFTKKSDLEEVISLILKNYRELDRIFVLKNVNDNSSYYCTYNISMDILDNSKMIKNTISFHRNKETNTLYTINAINYIVKMMNNGILDKDIKINWENYRNSILMIVNEDFSKISTEVHKIINL